MGKMGSTVPHFSPRIAEKEKAGLCYEDGRVFGAVNVFETPDGKKGIVIHEWSSDFTGQGHTTEALLWLRRQGYVQITANSVGMIEGGIGDISTCYWLHMHAKGLVDTLLDDEGVDITPVKQRPGKGTSARM